MFTVLRTMERVIASYPRLCVGSVWSGTCGRTSSSLLLRPCLPQGRGLCLWPATPEAQEVPSVTEEIGGGGGGGERASFLVFLNWQRGCLPSPGVVDYLRLPQRLSELKGPFPRIVPAQLDWSWIVPETRMKCGNNTALTDLCPMACDFVEAEEVFVRSVDKSVNSTLS
ncbi:hypothetical protein NHX12_013253 [Muraenolepis orangiensis]|uniref:Uncharacterized protein n=1 Tax=Muraenolepis orangiensis TaxID=630683 RepID=A0A9Q0DFV1_9TELE|nr:hypothetical protein NHX12_013253 [Muraenolepis orangiensis]